ncbi:guanine deaminase isoform X2 [Cimex lectularius]|uniref:Guanine deaminase n=1 Tax=Cimex lectularius TaxID=79782 RepID=A0A8I6RMS9_CIMLE|nr:guanine deaminase isoform X2 [Cimex lectularius]
MIIISCFYLTQVDRNSRTSKKMGDFFHSSISKNTCIDFHNHVAPPIIIQGPIVHSVSKDRITALENKLIAVKDGKIVALEDSECMDEIRRMIGDNFIFFKLEPGMFLCPGFIDGHIHAPQFPNVGLGMDKSLLDWLSTYTIPLEKKYKDVNFSETVYNYVVDTTLKCGTTTACYFSTIFKNNSKLLAEIVRRKGQRALIGKVNMNQNSVLDYFEETDESLKETEEFVKDVFELNSSLVEPVITPRFAISCDKDLLKKLGSLAEKYDLYVQSHISENLEEIKLTMELFPDCANYADVYDKAGLLTNKTILAHGVHLLDDELLLLSRRGTAIVHCPNSNTYLKSGLCDVKRLLDNKIKVALGTDVSGGISLSIMDAMRTTLATSNHLSILGKQVKPLTYHEAFYLATLGGAEALNKEKTIGNFQVGKDFDALVVDMEVKVGSMSCSLATHNLLELVQKFIYLGDDRNIKMVFVQGKPVVNK